MDVALPLPDFEGVIDALAPTVSVGVGVRLRERDKLVVVEGVTDPVHELDPVPVTVEEAL